MENKKSNSDYKAKHKYEQKSYERVMVVMPKGMREPLRKKASEDGVSLNRYILEAVEAKSGLKLTLDNTLPWLNQKKEN